MDIKDQLSSGFIRVDDLVGGPRRNVIQDVRLGQFKRLDAEFQDGAKLSLNQTNMRALADAWSTETDNWIGKEVELYIGETTYNGEKRDSVLLRPISPPIPLSERPAPAPARKPDFNDEIPF
jgi:hypothetical protein